MDNENRIVLEPAALGGLGELIPTPKTVVSPLRGATGARLEPQHIAGLRSAGVLDEQEHVTEAFQPMLESLAQVLSFARVQITGPSGTLDHAAFFPPAEQAAISLSMVDKKLVLRQPANIMEILNEVRQWVGDTARKPAEWNVELPPAEALACAALLDLRRKAGLRALADSQPAQPGFADPVMVNTAIMATPSPQLVVTAMRNLYRIDEGLPADQVKNALNALADKGIAVRQGNLFGLAEAPAGLADRLLVFHTTITIRAGHENNEGKVGLVQAACLQSGIFDLLYIEWNGQQMRLQSVSPATFLNQLKFYLTSADAVPAPVALRKEYRLVMVTGPTMGQAFVLGEQARIGRALDCEIQISDPRSSRNHCMVTRQPEGYLLSDMGSTNGTLLNGAPVIQPILMKDGDTLAIGETFVRLLCLAPGAPLPPLTPPNFAAVLLVTAPPAPVPAAWQPSVPAVSQPSVPAVSQPPVQAAAQPPAPAAWQPPVQAVSQPPVHTPMQIPPAPYPPTPLIPPAPYGAPSAAPVYQDAWQPPVPAVSQPPVQAVSQPPAPPSVQPPVPPAVHFPVPVGPEPPVQAAPPAPTVCPNCNSPLNPGARFCGSCGHSLV